MKTMCPPYWLSPQWFCSISCTWTHDLHNCISCAQVPDLLQSHCNDNWKGTLFS